MPGGRGRRITARLQKVTVKPTDLGIASGFGDAMRIALAAQCGGGLRPGTGNGAIAAVAGITVGLSSAAQALQLPASFGMLLSAQHHGGGARVQVKRR